MEADAKIARLAARQRGVLTREQAHAAGITDRQLQWRVRRQTLVRAEPGVYRVAAAPRTWHQSVLIVCLAEAGWASHRTAAAVWALDGCRQGVVEVLTPRWMRRPNRSVHVHETRLFDPSIDAAEVEGIPVTSCERTVVDLAAVLPTERIEAVYHDALNRGLLTPESTWRCLERLDVPGRPWVGVVRRLVAPTLGKTDVLPNLFEARLVRVLVDGGLPAPRTQVELRRPDGSFLARVDALYEETRVVMECDSEQCHGGWVRRKQDFRRDRELTALGYRVLRMSWEDLTRHPEQVVQDVEGARRAASA